VRGHLKIIVVLLAVALFGIAAGVAAPDTDVNQYNAISERNVFGLRPPQPEAGPTNPPAPLPKITLTGITTILGNKRALMMLAPANLKPGEANKEQSLILTEGQREAEVEVLQIDEKRGSVKVNHSGTIMVLTFDKDGAKLPPTAPVRQPPGAPPLPTALPATAGAATTSPTTSPYVQHTRAGGRNIPGRNPRQPTAPANLPGAAGAGTSATTVPNPAGVVASAPQQDMTPEEQAIVNEIQRQANATIPTFQPVPATATAQGTAQQAIGTSPVPGVINPPTQAGVSPLVPQ
jgi:hypothetical protein